MEREEEIREEIRNAELKRDRDLLMSGLSFGLMICIYVLSIINWYADILAKEDFPIMALSMFLVLFSSVLFILFSNKFVDKYYPKRINKTKLLW